MKVNIKGASEQISVTTITIQPEEGQNMYPFHCINCGNFHQQIGGQVSKVYPIYEPSEQTPIISHCNSCRYKYTFQVYEGYQTKQVKVVLHARKQENNFYCTSGKTRILEFSPKAVFLAYGGEKREPPFLAQCPEERCRVMYFFADLV